MAEQHNSRYHGNQQRRPENRDSNPVNWVQINLIKTKEKPLNAELFNSIAKEAAKTIADANDKSNKPTQLRRFYDELVLWETRIQQAGGDQRADKLKEFLPFILMMNAKAAYAEGRNPKLVTSEFVSLLNHTLGEVKKSEDPETLTHCKLFWEAFMGFYKQVRPKD